MRSGAEGGRIVFPSFSPVLRMHPGIEVERAADAERALIEALSEWMAG